MRIGEILLEHGWVDASGLARAIAEQRHTGKRLCSLLIARGLLDPDHAARALGEQHGVAAVLQRHLEHRERALGSVLTASLARTECALPIGRMRDGTLVVCVRDPTAGRRATLARMIEGKIVLAVAPADQLEALVDLTYEPTEEFDVDLTTGPIEPVDPFAPSAGGAGFALVELDDHRVVKDPTQSGLLHLPGLASRLDPPTSPPRAAPPEPPTSPPLPAGLAPPTSPPRAPDADAPTLEAALVALRRSPSRDAATDHAMRVASGRWSSALLLTIKEGAALGYRGFGPQLSDEAVQAVALPLSAPSIVKLAYTNAQLARTAQRGAIQDRLTRLLGQPRAPAAVPILVAERVACVLAVGDPLAGAPADDMRALESLADALGEAYTRIVRDKKS